MVQSFLEASMMAANLNLKPKRSISKIIADKKRSQTRLNIGDAFLRWRELMEAMDMRFDAELAIFLLD